MFRRHLLTATTGWIFKWLLECLFIFIWKMHDWHSSSLPLQFLFILWGWGLQQSCKSTCNSAFIPLLCQDVFWITANAWHQGDFFYFLGRPKPYLCLQDREGLEGGDGSRSANDRVKSLAVSSDEEEPSNRWLRDPLLRCYCKSSFSPLRWQIITD